MLTTNGYSPDDMIITSCPSAEQVSIMLSSASILAADAMINFSAGQRKISTTSVDNNTNLPQTSTDLNRKNSLEKKVSFEATNQNTMENLTEVSETSDNNSSVTTPLAVTPDHEKSTDIPNQSETIKQND